MNSGRIVLVCLVVVSGAIGGAAQAPEATARRGIGAGGLNPGDRVVSAPTNNSRPFCCDYAVRPPLFFKETFDVDIPNETPITQKSVADPRVVLSIWGPGKAGIRRSHHTFPLDDPRYTFSGPAKGNWAVTLRHKDFFVDLRTVSKIRWRANNTGIRALHVIIRTADGNWFVSEQADGSTSDWKVFEFTPRELKWQALDIEAVVEGGPTTPDLSRVDEIGYTDLMTGGDVGKWPSGAAASRVDWIEIEGWSVARPGGPPVPVTRLNPPANAPVPVATQEEQR